MYLYLWQETDRNGENLLCKRIESQVLRGFYVEERVTIDNRQFSNFR